MAEQAKGSSGRLPRADANPRAPSFALVRTRLIEKLQDDDRHSILTLVAPPGYGKTVVMGELFRAEREAGRSAVWIAPGSGDSLAKALAGALLQRENSEGSTAVAELIEYLPSLDARTTVFIDKLEEFSEPEKTPWLDRLLTASPSGLRWRIATRSPVPIDRLEHLLQGRLREVGYPELSFSPRESRQLLGPSICSQLEPQDFDFLHEITEGWPAALRIIEQRLSASEHPRSLLRTFGEPQPDFAQYFDSRLLARLADDERSLLLELALLPEFEAELCARISKLEDPLPHLARLQTANRVASSRDGRGSLRLHPLIAIHCRARAQLQLDEAHRNEILSTAGAWYEAHQQWDRAIEVWLLAGQNDHVVTLLEQHCELLARDRGELVAMTRWVEALQARSIEPGPRAHFWYVWALVFRRRYGFADLQIDALTQHLEREAGRNEEAARLLSQIPVIRACIAIYLDQVQETDQLASGWLDANPDGDPFHIGEARALQALAHLDASRFADARRSLSLARAALKQSGSRYGLGWMEMFDGLVSLREGDVGRARSRLRSSMESLRADLGEDVPLLASMELICAKCSLDQGLDEEAENLLVSGLRVVQMHGHLDPLACGVDVGIALWTGTDLEEGQTKQLWSLANEYPSRLPLMLHCHRVQALLRLGRLPEARELAEEIGLDPEHAEPKYALEEVARGGPCRHLYRATHIRLAIAFSALERARRMIANEIALAREQNRVADQISLLLDSMVIGVKSAQNNKARQALTQAVCLAARRKLIRPFVERSDSIAPLVLNTRASDWGWAQDQEKRFFALVCRDLPLEGERIRDALEEVGIEPDLLSAVTHREIEFLKLIDLGLSNAQIAMRYELSVSTVKWHLYNLFGKLGAKSRSAAVSQAKALNLIS